MAFEGRRELEGVGTVTQSVIVGAGWGVRRRGRITQEGVAEVDVDGIVVDLYVLNGVRRRGWRVQGSVPGGEL